MLRIVDADPHAHLSSSEYEVRPLETWYRTLLVRQLHYSGGVACIISYSHGLFRRGEILSQCLGVAAWMTPPRPVAESVEPDCWRSVLALTRLAVEPGMPTNSASFLIARSRRMIPRWRWPVLLSYADTAHGHVGTIYRADNWSYEGIRPGGQLWVDEHGKQVTAQRRGGGVTKSLTAEQMRATGHTKLPQSDKHLFVNRHKRSRTYVERLRLLDEHGLLGGLDDRHTYARRLNALRNGVVVDESEPTRSVIDPNQLALFD